MRTWPLLLILLAGCPGSVPTPNPENIRFPSGPDVVQATVHHLPGTPRSPAVVLVHGDFGANDAVFEAGMALAARGIVTMVPDLYRGEKAGDLMDAHIMGRGLPDDRALADLRAAVTYLQSRPDVKPDAIGVIGFDMGGGYAFDLALADPRIKAVVTCYGRVPTEAATLAPLQAPVLAVFAGKDEGITPETREQFQDAMNKAGKRLAGVHVYAGCGHGFLDPKAPTPSGTNADRADAWAKIHAFLDAELRR